MCLLGIEPAEKDYRMKIEQVELLISLNLSVPFAYARDIRYNLLEKLYNGLTILGDMTYTNVLDEIA